MSVREYIGARYVPLFADPIQWDSTLSYEPLTVVKNQGTSYVSKQSVPEGIDILNETYWLRWADYNAQLEEYIRQVQQYNSRIQENADDIAAIESDNWVTNARIADNAVTANKIADGAVTTDKIPTGAVTSSKIADHTIMLADLRTETINSLLRNKIGIIGDSFTNPNFDGSLTPWPNLMVSATGYTVVNKAKSGTGFTTGTPTFKDQLEDLIENNDMNEFAYIIVYGGVNDWNDAHASASTVATAINALCDYYRANITGLKPKLIVAFGSIGKENAERYNGFITWYKDVMNIMKSGINGQYMVDNVPFWLMAVDDVRKADNLHPTQKGLNIIANMFTNIINGCYDGVHKIIRGKTQQVNYTGGNNDLGYYELMFDNGVVTWRMLNSNTMPDGFGNNAESVYVPISEPVLANGTLNIGNTDILIYSPRIYLTTGFTSGNNSLINYRFGLSLNNLKFWLVAVIDNSLFHTTHTFTPTWKTYPSGPTYQVNASAPCWGY